MNGAARWRSLRQVFVLVLTVLAAIMTAPVAVAAPSPTPTAGGNPLSPGDPAKKATFGIGPATAKGVDGRPYLNYLASPNSRFSDHVAVVNLAVRPITLNLYVQDATIASDGQFGYLARAGHAVDAGTWITPETPHGAKTVTVPARATIIVPIAIHVPSDAEPGDHAAGVIISVISKVTSNNGERVDFEQRVALRTFFRISGPLHPMLTVTNLKVHPKDSFSPVAGGSAVVTYTVRNSGNVRLGAHQKVFVSGLFGISANAKPLADVPLLLPHTSVNYSVTVKGVWPQFLMHARVQLQPLTVVGDVDPGLAKKYSDSKAFWAIPWIWLIILLALILVIYLWIRRARGGGLIVPGTHRFRDRGSLRVERSGDSEPREPAEPANV